MSHYKPYSAYRDSGVEWIGDVPSTWEVKRLRQVASFTNSGIDKKSYEGQEQVSLCNYTDVYYNEFITADMPFMQATATKNEIAQFTLKKGDLIITKDSEDPSDIGIPALVVENAPGVVCGYHLTLIRTAEIATARLLHRVLQSTPTHAYFYVESPGITRYGLGQDVIGDLRVCLPPESEIDRISDCIDRETKRIDSLIAKKTRFIELLKEKRQALITHAVTKGLDPNVMMKPSGVDLIGDVPAHWAIKRLKHLLQSPLKYGANESGDDTSENGPRYIRITDLDEFGNLRGNSVKRLPSDIAQPYMLIDGDILFARSGATVGKTYRYKSEHGPACFAGYLIRGRFDAAQVIPDFVALVVRSYYYWDYIQRTAIQATIENVGAERYGEFPLPVPTVNEQVEIVNAMNTAMARLDTLTAKSQHSIDLLKERRSAFITAAVTGQIDLREPA